MLPCHCSLFSRYSVFTFRAEPAFDLWPIFICLSKTSFHFQIGARFAREQEPLPYVVSQPLPWQVHSVSLSRRSSKADEVSYSKIDTAHHNVHYKPHQFCSYSFILCMRKPLDKTTSSILSISSLYKYRHQIIITSGTLIVVVFFNHQCS